MGRPRKTAATPVDIPGKPADPPRMLSIAEAKDVKTRLEMLGDTYHFRVRKRSADGTITSYIGRLPGDTPDLEDATRKAFGEGQFIVHAHWHDNKKVEQIPPITINLGDPDDQGRGYTPSYGPKGLKSKRLMALEEDIEAAKREKELLRAQRELERVQEEHDNNTSVEEVARLHVLEEALRDLKRRNDDLEKERKERVVLDHIARLESKLEQLSRPKVDPEVERLRREMEELRESRHQKELQALKESLESRNRIGPLEIAQMAAPFAPVFADLVKSRQNASLQMIDTITKVGTLLKDSMPKGLDIDKVVSLAPVIAKLLPSNNQSAMFEMVGNMVVPLIEAAAAGGGGGGDDMAGVIKQVLGAVQSAMAPKQGMAPQMPGFPGYPGAYAPPPGGPQGFPQAPPPGVAPQTQPNLPVPAKPAVRRRPQQQPQDSSMMPITRFAMGVADAISRRDESFGTWVSNAERILTDTDLATIRHYHDGATFSSFLTGQPGVNANILTTSYAKRWLGEFLRVFHGGMTEEATPTPVATPALTPPPTPVVHPKAPPPPIPMPRPDTAARKDSTEHQSFAEILGMGEPTPAKMPRVTKAPQPVLEKEIAPGIRRPNTFDYPEDSEIAVVKDYDTPLGAMDLVVERPTQETIEKRERERAEMAAKYANPPECNVKMPEKANV